MSNAIVPVVPKRNAVTGAGYPTSLALGVLDVNTTSGDVYLGADPGVVQIGVALAAGTYLNLGVGTGSQVAFTIAGGTGTDAGGYLVSVGGVDQPSGWTVAGTTLTFSEAPPTGAVVSIRAILKGTGGGGSSNATQLQGRDIATTAPTDGQLLGWNATTSKWEPTTLAGGSVTFNTEGTHYWRVPAYVRYARVQAQAGDGTVGTNGQGTDGQDGFDRVSGPYVQHGENGTNGYGSNGIEGRTITFDGVVISGGAAGQAGSIGYGGGGGGCFDSATNEAWPGADGNGFTAGKGGGPTGPYNEIGLGGESGGYDAQSGQNGTVGGAGGQGAYDQPGGYRGGAGGHGAIGNFYTGGGGGGGLNGCGGGGGGASYWENGGFSGLGGKGAGGTGAGFGGSGTVIDSAHFFTAGALVPITISAGAGTASITITY